ncbi:DUF2975 domain-containing protein [Flavihumibacter petaseus]|uniref:DUF2975 domain-containing protein n=1 Tax=Flavihumibacter petaseus NBRC 106054 TaxID=1220578 RepID=A0A0E9N203_9BACT|nr:DUF2975 domain-containing protein [Flavihumibacter petaseus]GAO43828.1 hypothetical protein FPE01S_02_09340 [Flavihumibacter petaseus NBRC 106054]
MEFKITLRHILNILLILSWIIFIGICIEAGGFILNAIFALVKPGAVKQLWQQVDLSALFRYDKGHFFAITLIMSIVAILKATMFYQIIRILHRKDLDLALPFSKTVQRFIVVLACLALMIGFFCSYGINYTGWLVQKGVTFPDTQYLRFGGSDVWYFMAVVLFVISQLFKRGIEIQSENELTI